MNSTRFVKALEGGYLGIRLQIPDSFELLTEAPLAASFRDNSRSIEWRIRHSLNQLDLNPAYDDLLRDDIHASARGLFEATELPPKGTDWSPVVDIHLREISNSRCVAVIYRRSYEPGNEVVVGELQVPLEKGTAVIETSVRASTTGLRETTIIERAIHEGLDSPDPDAFLEAVSELDADNPKYDELFDRDPLSRVRSAMAWLMEGSILEVTDPLQGAPRGEITLPEAESAVTLPPRYQVIPGFGGAEGMVTTSRVCPPSRNDRFLDLWKVPMPPITGWRRKKRLMQFAENLKAEWTRAGAEDVNVLVKGIEEFRGRAQVAAYATCRTTLGKCHSALIWFLDSDGSVFRVEAGAPRFIPRRKIFLDAEALVNSWRRLRPFQHR